MQNSCLAIILAAGEGTRMKSSTPKVLHRVAGLPMVGHVIETAKEADVDKRVVVVGVDSRRVKTAIAEIDSECEFSIQQQQQGTAHAVLTADTWLKQNFEHVLVLNGDVPLITKESLSTMRQKLRQGADLVVMGFETDNPYGYGRMLVENGQLLAIREQKDASDEEKAITFCNGGVMAFNGRVAHEVLQAIDNNNAQSEYYLTDAVELLHNMGKSVVAHKVDKEETLGINNRVQLAEVENIWQQRRRKEMMLAGVTLAAPETVYFCHDTEIAPDCTIEPNVVFGSGVKVAGNVSIRAFSHLEGATIGKGAAIGPFTRLRPEAELLEGAKVGNFCEVKKSVIGQGAKINHLSYIGDASIGAGSNIGAGTITCNYDGINKHHTDIGKNVFVGTNSSLVAPLVIGDGAYIASGSVITKDVPAGALGIGRSKHVNKDDYAAKIRGRNAATKARRTREKPD